MRDFSDPALLIYDLLEIGGYTEIVQARIVKHQREVTPSQVMMRNRMLNTRAFGYLIRPGAALTVWLTAA